MHQLRRWMPEVSYLALVALWALTSGAVGDEPATLGNIGVSLGGLALLIRAIAPLLRPHAANGLDRDDIRWQEHMTTTIDQLTKTVDAWLVEQRRHNRAIEGYMQRDAS